MFPIVAISALYMVNETKTKLGIIAAFTGLFSITMSVFTMGSVAEIFAATAA
jgi:hypothetical protein